MSNQDTPLTIDGVTAHPDGTVTRITLRADGRGSLLGALQGAVGGGYVERVTTYGPERDWNAYCDEDGKNHGQARNLAAERIIAAQGHTLLDGDWLVGDVVFVGAPDEDDDPTNLPQRMFEHVTN